MKVKLVTEAYHTNKPDLKILLVCFSRIVTIKTVSLCFFEVAVKWILIIFDLLFLRLKIITIIVIIVPRNVISNSIHVYNNNNGTSMNIK